MPQGVNIGTMMAQVPSYQPTYPVSLDGLTEPKKLRPNAPKIVTANASTKKDAYNSANNTDVPARIVMLQNQGTKELMYALNTDVTSTVYHGILAGSTAGADGLGGNKVFDVVKLGINQISVISSAAVVVSVESYIELA